ncbi:MAG: FkbM family methyltransferase [Alphaproteobacteria bacterium]|nr:MAG: FkbM family methyltransferase [Alphaproteobacteria bacterium]
MSRAVSYSMFAEDIIASKYLRDGEQQFYVDVGCCFPIVASNTYRFYEAGWRGICLDANPDVIGPFRDARPRDTVICTGVGGTPGALTFHRFGNPVYNTFDPERAARVKRRKPHIPVFEPVEVTIRPLTSVLSDAGCPERFDFLNIDVEGLESEVIGSLDFQKFRPRMIACETIVKSVREAIDLPVTRQIEALGYRLIATTGHDSFFFDLER